MNSSPPVSSPGTPRQVSSAMAQPRSSSCKSLRSRSGSAGRTQDEELKTAVKVGSSQPLHCHFHLNPPCSHCPIDPAIRVRPPLGPSDTSFDSIPQRFRGSTCQVNNSTTLSVQAPQGKKLFVFDRVFSDQDGQEQVWDYVSEGITSFLQGYNVSILAYGQSGAGKSYTMGTSSSGEQSDQTALGTQLYRIDGLGNPAPTTHC